MAAFALLAGQLGPLTPNARALEPDGAAERVVRPEGGVVEANPAPITTPGGSGGADSIDPSIGSAPMFVPYNPPAEETELADRRTQTSRTLAKPDGSFELEVSDGPINYQDQAGAWQPIDVKLIPDDAGGYRVAANAAAILVDTLDGELGVIEIDGHRVSLSAPGYSSGALGSDQVSELDANTVTFGDALGVAADLWVRPVDIGLEFGATWQDASASPVVSVVLDSGDLTPSIAKDGRSIVFSDAAGKFNGRIDPPIVREGSEDGAPLLDVASVALVSLSDGSHLLSYSLDPKWLEGAERVFPVVLDPTWCIGQGASGCDDNYTSSTYNYDTFVFDADPDSYEVGWTVLRAGYDSRSDDGGSYGKMRTLLKFKHVSLPDGAVIYDTDLQTRLCCLYGGAQGETVSAYRVTKFWANPVTWNQIGAKYTTAAGVSATVPASGYMNWDVDALVQGWYTRTSKKRTDDFGFMLRMANEGSSYGEVEFRRYNYGTAAYRPLLTINFAEPVVGIDFDARLGSTYSPSSMVANLPTRMPIVVEDKTGSHLTLTKCDVGDTDCWKVGYSWFDAKGNLVAGGNAASTTDLPASVGIGNKSSTFPVTVTPPATAGQYTLRLDLVRYFYGTYAWASDYAQSQLFYSRNKKVLTADSTRWTGSSAIERAEFSINVTAGAGGGAVESVAVPSGDQLGIDLYSKNLAYSADTGLGFADRLPLSLTYGYNEAIAKLCQGYQGILASCGWSTTWDERITGGANKTGFDYSYVDPNGTPYMLDTDNSGQIVGGAPVLINRQRVTIIDENAGWDGGTDADADPDISAVTGGEVAQGAFAGQFIGKVAANANRGVAGPDKVTLNTYRRVRFAMQTTASIGPVSAGLCFNIHNLTDSTNYPDRWFCYTVGTSWTTGFDQVNLGLQSGVGSLKGSWNYYDRDLYADISADPGQDFGATTDDFQVISVQILSSSSGNQGSTYIDGFRFEAVDSTLLDESNPTWTTGSSTTASDAVVGLNSIKVTPAGLSPQCKVSACMTTVGLWSDGFASWYWKKAGGTSAAMVFWIHDKRSGAPCNATDCTVAYYVGSPPNLGTSVQLRVSTTLPATWTLVRRNLLEDARQSLSLYDDDNTGAGDDLELKGYAPVAIDGTSLLVDRLGRGGLADSGGVDPTGLPSQRSHPATVGDAPFTYDYTADYPDGSRHYFNRDGLLVLIRDRDGQAITLDWTYDAGSSGPTAYNLSAIHAPGDATSSGGVTFDRQFTLSRGADGSSLSTLRVDEVLGSTSSDVSTRTAVFESSFPSAASQSGSSATATDGVNNNRAWLGSLFYAKPGTTVTISGTVTGQSERSVGIICPDAGPAQTFVVVTGSGPWNVSVPGSGQDGCHAYIATPGPGTATVTTWQVNYTGVGGDLAKLSPARTIPAVPSGPNGTFCGTRPPANGCLEFTYPDTTGHRLQYLADPRWDGTSGATDYRLEVGRDGSNVPTSIKDRSHGGATLLNVLTWNDTQDPNLLYNRPQWQDAAAVAATAAIATDLNPDGSVLTRYAPRICTPSCGTLPSSTTQSQYKAVDYLFDGLARVNTVKTYRCPTATESTPGWGCSTGERVSVTRSEANASAKIDNYADPLTGGQVLWSASADEVFASLRDSGGTNADWYRTEYIYDGTGQVAETIEVRELAVSTYAETVKANGPYGYWRLNETSGSTMTDESGNSRNGSYYATPSLGGTGVLVRDSANKAPTFNGSTQYGKVPYSAMGTYNGSFTVEGWVKSTSATADQVWISTRGTAEYTFDSQLTSATGTGGKGIRLNVGNSGGWLLSATVPFDWQTYRWYYLAVVVDNGLDLASVYVDGQLLAALPFTTAGTPMLTNSTHELFIGQTGLSSYHRWFAGQIDEVGVYTKILQASDIAAHFRAGRAVATVDTTVIRDSAGRPTETAASFLANPGFEQAGNGWAMGSGASISTADANSGAASLGTSTTATTQIAQLAPGQVFRLQFATKAAASTSVNVKLEYSNTSGTWAVLGGLNNSYAETSWTTHAFDVRLPITGADGRLRISLSKTGTGTGSVDDVILVTRWSKVAYNLSAGLTLGLPTDRYGLATCPSGPCATPTIRTGLVYAAGTTSPNYYPGTFPQQTVANWQDGLHQTTDGPAEDVMTQMTYDAWGRQLTSKDPDLVETETVYATNQTDVAVTRDGLDHPTSMTYDEVGNVKATTSPLGRVSSATYDFRNQRLTTTDPAGVVTETDYNDFGQATATWANRVDESPNGADDDILTKLAYDRFGRVIQQDVECGSPANCATGLDARTETTYDLLGNTVTMTVYPGSGGTGSVRVATSHFDTTPGATNSAWAGLTFSRTTSSGVRLAIPPGTAAPFCPGSTTVRCNSVTALDLGGRAIAQTDAYGIVTKSRLDLDGHAVQAIANYGDGSPGPNPDDDVITYSEYDVLGNTVTSTDPLGRYDVRTYDALGRVLTVAHKDNAGATYLSETTDYTPAGRISKTHDGSAWTRTIYDGAGRAVQTIANDDQAGNAGMTLDAFEGALTGWSSIASGFFTTNAAASLATDADTAGNLYETVAPYSGRGRLHLTTHASNTNTGAWLDLSGRTYQAGHVYKASFDLVASSASLGLTAYLGQDQSGGSYGQLTINSTTAWTPTPYTVTWTPASSISSTVHFAVTKAAVGTAQIYLDNLVIWDSTAPQTGIVSSVTAYNDDGEIAASVLPPGDPATERPVLTSVGFDPAGRGVVTTVNGTSGAYAATILGTANLAAYVPLDERIGPSVADKKSGGGALTVTGAPRRGLAGGIDEARTSTGTASGSFASRASNATSNTTTVSIEAWLRSDAANPASTVVVAANGTNTNGWGIGVDSSGNAAGFAIASSTLTTMSSTAKVNDGKWHHVVLTRGASTWAMTFDGGPKTLTNNTSSPGTPGAGLSIGALSDGTRAFTGEVDEVSVYTADISGSTAAAHWAAGRRTDTITALTSRSAYDRLGRPTDTWAPDLVRTKATYDRLGRQTETFLNYLDGTTSGTTADDDVRSTFAYDVLGELTGYCPAVQVKAGGCDPANAANTQAWHYVFDDLGRQTKTIPAVNQTAAVLATSETVYEAGGRIGQTCAYPAGGSCGTFNSRHVDFTYDDLSRILTQKTWDRGASPAADTLKFTKTLTWNADGSPASVAEGATTLNYVYDAAGRPSQFKNGSTQLSAWTYTAGTSTVATRTDGSTNSTSFGYDWARRATSVTATAGTFSGTGTVSRTYRVDGTLATQSFPSSITETLAYDPIKRPTTISLGSAGSLSQSFDRAGRVTSDGRSLTNVGGDAGGNTQTFNYDGLSRLTSSAGVTPATTNAYDLDGNRTTRTEGATTTTFTYDRTDVTINQAISGTPRTFIYDQYGNLKSASDKTSATTIYAYDEANRLTTITPPTGGQVTFTLDPLDRHATRLVAGASTDNYGYAGPTETAWQTGTTTPTSALLDADGSRLAIKTGLGTVTWLIFDLHGSVVALCPAGDITLSDAYRYDGFGQQIASAGTATNPWRYRGLLNIGSDSSTWALLDMGARDYSAQLGQFTQQDSVQGQAANPLSMNRFLYALANPATLIDPDGHAACEADPCNEGATAVGTNKSGYKISKGPPKPNGPPQPCLTGGCQKPPPFKGYAPWDVDSDALLSQLLFDASHDCQLGIQAACTFFIELDSWRLDNEALYCSWHAAECEAANSAQIHGLLSLTELLPVVDAPATLAEVGTYLHEGDFVGAGITAATMIPFGDALRLLRHGDEVADGGSTATIVARGGVGPVLKGQRGVSVAADAIRALGGEVIGREVTVLAGTTRTKIDLVVRLGGPEGRLVFIEVKTGPFAALTTNQGLAFPLIRKAGGEIRTDKLVNFGVPKGTHLDPTEIWTLRYEWG